MRELLDILPEPMLLLDPDGVLLQVNSAALALLGWSFPGPLGRPLAEGVDEPGPWLDDLVRQGLRSTQFSPGRLTLRGEDGVRRTVRCELARLEATDQRPLAVLLRMQAHAVGASRFLALNERIEALSREVARRQAAEDALRTQSDWLGAVLRSIGDAVIATDADGRVVFMNTVAETLCGWPSTQAAGQPVASVFRIVDGRTRAPAPCPVARALRERRVVGLQPGTLLLGRQGQEHPVDDAAGPIVDDDGELLGVVLVFREISQRLRAERQRERFEQQLRDAQRLEAVGTLAGGIAHDFNNVLGAILGNAMLAREDLDPAHPAMSRLAQIDRAGRRARELVRQIMAFSRRQPRQLSVQPLQPLVEECVTLLRSTLPSAVRLEARLAPEPLRVMADASQVVQVLMNFCTNAWQALQARGGGIAVTLDAYAGDRPPGLAPGLDAWVPGTYARVSVCDDGPGIAPQVLPYIFEPFYTTKEAGEGTGLGLSVVHGIVAGHGGLLAVRSSPGAGTCFELLLPLTAEPGAPDAAHPAHPAHPAPAPQPLAMRAAMHVAYVDDDELVGLTTGTLLQRAGFRVWTFVQGSELLDRLHADPRSVDVLVTDYNMPGLDGLTVAAQARRRRPDLPVILTSGYITDAMLEGAQALGSVRLLNKEDSFEQLPALIDEVLSSR